MLIISEQREEREEGEKERENKCEHNKHCSSISPKLITSNIFKLLSSEVVLKRNPSQLAAMLSILPTERCD